MYIFPLLFSYQTPVKVLAFSSYIQSFAQPRLETAGVVSAGQAQRKNVSEESSLKRVNEAPLSCGKSAILGRFSHPGADLTSPAQWALAQAGEPGFPARAYRRGTRGVQR